MSATERFDRDLADLLAGLAEPRFPDYFDDVLERAVSVKQRPAWTFPERWFPMGVIARRPAFLPALPWRTIGLLIVLLLILLATIIIGVGAVLQQQRPAPPFGVAANGVFAYTHEGDIFSRDPATGESRLVVGGEAIDFGPAFSRDGTTLTWIRGIQLDPDVVAVMAARADGSDVRTLVEAEPAGELHWSHLSPNGDMYLLANSAAGVPRLSVVNVGDGSRAALELPVVAESFEWLPDSSEIIFRGIDGREAALYAVRPDGSDFRRLTENIPGTMYDIVLSVSHDGRFVGYNARHGSIHLFHILDLQTGEDLVHLPPIGGHEGHPVFSPDNQRVAFIRYTPPEAQAYIGPIEGKSSDATPIGPSIRLPDYRRGLFQQFSPDGKSLLIVSEEGQVWLADVATSEYEETTWDRDEDEVDIAWQRRAP